MKNRREHGGIISKLLILTLLLIVMAIGGIVALGWWLLSKTIESNPFPPQVMAFTAVDAGSAFNKLKPLGMQVMQSHPDQTMELILTPGELNAVFSLLSQANAYAAMLGLGTCQWPQGLELKREGDGIMCYYSRTIPFESRFGKYFNVQLAFEPKMRDGKLDYRIIAFQAGTLRIPAFLLQKYLEWQMNSNPSATEIFKKTVVDLYIDNHNDFHLKFYPFQIRQLIANQGKKKISPNDVITPSKLP